jgi:two-component system response regulator RegX3
MGHLGDDRTDATGTKGPRRGKGLAKSAGPAPGFDHAGSVHLLVVEDDDAIAAPLVESLERAGFTASRAANGKEARNALQGADLILLDLGLPDVDGSELCRQIRLQSNVPIIIVTARGEESERVLGLELGADDYIVKPFGTRELIARVRAVARRSSPSPDLEGIQVAGRIEIDRRTRRVRVDGADVELTPKEFDLLALLGEDAGAVVTRQEIMDEVWDPHWYGPTKTLDVHVASLRKKLGDATLIETVRSVGFRLPQAH